MTAGFSHVRLDALEPVSPPYDDVPPRWLPLRSLLGVTSFGINAWQATDAGEHVVERHDELVDCGCEGVTPAGHEELYLVLRGAADFTVGDESFPTGPGSIVFIADPGLVREAIATEPGTIVLAVGGPKGSFSVSEWETRWLAASA